MINLTVFLAFRGVQGLSRCMIFDNPIYPGKSRQVLLRLLIVEIYIDIRIYIKIYYTHR